MVKGNLNHGTPVSSSDYQRKGAVQSLLRPCVIIALYALLLPVVGPALDHHYAEWQHNHGHVYFGGRAEMGLGFHSHVYDGQASHVHRASGLSGEKGAQDGVAYFASYDGSGHAPINSPTGPSTDSVRYPDGADGLILLSHIGTDTVPEGVLNAPPRKPPRYNS